MKTDSAVLQGISWQTYNQLRGEVEVDSTSPSFDKQGLYAAINVGEIWHYEGKFVTILTLNVMRGECEEASVSEIFPRLNAVDLSRFVNE